MLASRKAVWPGPERDGWGPRPTFSSCVLTHARLGLCRATRRDASAVAGRVVWSSAPCFRWSFIWRGEFGLVDRSGVLYIYY
jgi:hypothetical protein